MLSGNQTTKTLIVQRIITSPEQIIPNNKFSSLLDFYYSLIQIKIIYDYATCLHNSQILLYTEITCPTSLSIPYTCWENKTNTTLISHKTNYGENKTKLRQADKRKP